MGIEEVNRIKELVYKWKLNPTYLEHVAVITSEDAAKTRGFELRQGIKSLVLTDGRGNWAVVDIPADKKVDGKKVAVLMGWSRGNVRFASAEEVFEVTGCEIGAVPPFGHKEKIKIIYDKTIFENKISTFNIGLRTHSLKIPTEEMKVVFNNVMAVEGDFIKV